MNRETFGRFMKNVVGAKYIQPHNAVVGEHMADTANQHRGTSRQPTLITKDRATGYKLGQLAPARVKFAKKTGLAVEWEREAAPKKRATRKRTEEKTC